MTYDQLVTLDAIIKTGSFKGAAEKLHKSQPSISVAIKKLEEEFQLQIFSREEYRPKLTEDGIAFYEKAKVAIFHMQSLNALGEELAMSVETEVKVGLDLLSPREFIFSHLKNFFDDFPKTNLNLTMDVISGTHEKLLSGDIQIGFMPITPNLSKLDDLEYIPVSKVQMLAVISNQHYRETEMSLENIRKIPQVILGSTGKDKSQSYGILEGGRKWNINDAGTKKEIILSGLGWGRLPDHTIIEELKNKTLRVFEVPGSETFIGTIYMVKSRKHPLGPISKQLWKKFKETCSDLNKN